MAKPKEIENIKIPGCGGYQRITHADGGTSLVKRDSDNEPGAQSRNKRRKAGERKINWNR